MSQEPYACHNREPFKDTVTVKGAVVGENGFVIPKVVSFPFRMRLDCSYTTTELGQADERCHGCKWRKDNAA